MQIRPMTPADIPAAVDICSRNHWTGMPETFGFITGHPDCHPFVGERDGQVVATGSGLCRGAAGWIGQISVLAEHRGHGLGKAMTQHVMESLLGLGCRSLRLFATPAGRPVYEKLGFVVDAVYQQFHGPALPAAPDLEPLTEAGLAEFAALDREATGEDRSAQLDTFRAAGGWAVAKRGFCVVTPWGAPVITAADPEAGRLLVEAVLAHAARRGLESLSIAVPLENTAATAYLRTAGFEPGATLPRMVWGEPVAWRPELVWGRMSGAFS